jgi:hypothetical protein
MRNLALLLILLNLAFAAWHAWFAASLPELSAAPSAAPTRSLTLVSEVPALRADPTVGPATTGPDLASEPIPTGTVLESAPGDAVSLRCLSVGPFRELSQVAEAAANLRAAGYEPVQRVTEGDIWIGYWVYIASIPTRAQANEILSDLHAHDISDSYVIPGDEGFLISLGVFSEVARAGRRREEVRALGQEPTVVDRTRRGTVYWIDVRWSDGQTFDLEILQTPGRITRLEQHACGDA